MLTQQQQIAVEQHWFHLRPLIKKAIKWMGGTHDELDLLAGVKAGRLFLFPGHKSFIMCSIERTPKLSICHMFLANGDRAECASLEQRVAEWAKQNGCKEIHTLARMGLAHLDEKKRGYYTTSGYKRARVLYVKELT